MSQAEVVREAVAAYVGRIEENPSAWVAKPRRVRHRDMAPLCRRWAKLAGSLEGPGDLSTNPAYMEGFGES